MNKFHGFAVYGTLALLLLLQVSRTPASDGQQAVAQTAPSRARLGPADSIDLVDQNGAAVTLRALSGRIVWSDRPTARVLSVGFIQIGDILKQLMETEEFMTDRQKKRDEYDRRYREFTAKNDEIRKRIEGLNPADPRYRETYGEYQAALKEYETWRQTESRTQSQYDAAAVAKAFADFQAAVEVVAKRMDIDVVMQATAPDDKVSVDDYARARTEVEQRTILQYPEALDITAEVRQELGVKEGK